MCQAQTTKSLTKRAPGKQCVAAIDNVVQVHRLLEPEWKMMSVEEFDCVDIFYTPRYDASPWFATPFAFCQVSI